MSRSISNKKGPGRPKNPNKPEQFSIRLPANLKFGLELLSRKRNVSLSQTCEFAIATTLRAEKFDGKPILEIADDAIRTADDRGNALVLHTSARILTALRLPSGLRTPEEQYVLETYTTMRSKLTAEDMDPFYGLAAKCFNSGLSQREAVKQIASDLSELHQPASSNSAKAKR